MANEEHSHVTELRADMRNLRNDMGSFVDRLHNLERNMSVARAFAIFFGIAAAGGVGLFVNAYSELSELNSRINTLSEEDVPALENRIDQLLAIKDDIERKTSEVIADAEREINAYADKTISRSSNEIEAFFYERSENLFDRIKRIEGIIGSYGVVIDGDAPVRTDPEITSKPLARLKEGSSVTINSSYSNWYSIVEPVKGWIHKTDVDRMQQ